MNNNELNTQEIVSKIVPAFSHSTGLRPLKCVWFYWKYFKCIHKN